MQNLYTKNYLKIYFWQGASLILNFLSMFIVVPYLTSEPTIYGIYIVCISITIFMAYADLGFIGAGQKYAAEYFIRGDLKEEIKVIGFTNFILLVFLLLFSVGFLILSFHPELLIKNLDSGKEETIASTLLLVLAIFTPVTLLQRLLQMIFAVRLEDYVIHRSNIIASSLKILSILYFFRKGHYNIVGYFLFTQIINLLTALIILFIAKIRYNYEFKTLIKSIRFNKIVFSKTKRLAFTSLYLTFTWILYYELDPVAIGYLLGAKQVAIYAIGLTILSFFRSILGILFSPFNIRFNHLIGIHDEDGLKSLIITITTFMAPFIIIPITTICLLAQPLIICWVGIEYSESVSVAQFLILCNLFAFITYPTSFLLMGKEKIKEMYFVNTIIPLIYWTGIISTYTIIGLKSFAFFKFVAFSISSLAYFLILKRYLALSISQLVRRYIGHILFPLLLLFGATILIFDYLPHEKSKINLLIVASTAVCLIMSSFVLHYFLSEKWRTQIIKIIKI